MTLPDGETVLAEERFFLIRTEKREIHCSGWSQNEKRVIQHYHWWTAEELRDTTDTIFPHDLITDILSRERA